MPKCPRCGNKNYYRGFTDVYCPNTACDLHDGTLTLDEDNAEYDPFEVFWNGMNSNLDWIGSNHGIKRKKGEADDDYKRRIYDAVTNPSKKR